MSGEVSFFEIGVEDPEGGRAFFKLCQDDQGSRFGLHQPPG